MDSLFRCPLCSHPLQREEHRWLCPSGHSFDRAAAGYVHLLPANKKHSKDPGDDREMVAARSAFLDAGYYTELREALCRVILEHSDGLSSPCLLDSGCGEGYYTQGMKQALLVQGKHPQIAGVDLSRYALRKAAKRVPDGEFAVASVYHLPFTDAQFDLLTNVFSPLAVEEFARVLKPGGLFCYVVPSARHLWEMKQVLYENPYENPVKREDYPGFSYLGCREVSSRICLSKGEHIMALFGMTPYAWKTPRAGVERLGQLNMLDTTIGFTLHLYRRT